MADGFCFGATHICLILSQRSSDEHICHIYHLLMTQLNEDHAQIRLSAFQIVDELFTRSHQFRTLIISNFQELLELTVETNYDQPLPPPEEVAQNLKTIAIKSVQRWHEEYGEAYKKLSLGYHFLKQNKKVLNIFICLCSVGKDYFRNASSGPS